MLDDPLLFLNLKWKEAMLFGNVPMAFTKGVLHGFAFLTLPIFVALFFLKFRPTMDDKILFIIIFSALVTLCSLDLKQAFSNYFTSYQYGAHKKSEAIEKLSKSIKNGDIVLATPEFLYELRDKNIPSVPWKIWQSPKAISGALEKMEPKAIVLGLTTHSFDQLKWIFGYPKIKSQLNRNLKRYRVGTYFIWLRV